MRVRRHAWIRLRCLGSYTDRDGTRWVDPAALMWEQIPYIQQRDCQHRRTMCSSCWDSWECDCQIRTIDPWLYGDTVNRRVRYPDVLIILPETWDRQETVGVALAELEATHGLEAARELYEATAGAEEAKEVLQVLEQFVFVMD
jgi:hypothetical protein